MSKQAIFEKLIPLIREVLGVKSADITLNTCLVGDLGAESIDLLDLTFLIEQDFGISIEANEFERIAKAQLNDQPYEENGILTVPALEYLKIALPEIEPSKFSPGLRKIQIPSLLTVAVYVNLIDRKLASKGTKA
ncbi:acyl carrier protein [bacterium]|nr:acyl carrier protein [bacterium]